MYLLHSVRHEFFFRGIVRGTLGRFNGERPWIEIEDRVKEESARIVGMLKGVILPVHMPDLDISFIIKYFILLM